MKKILSIVALAAIVVSGFAFAKSISSNATESGIELGDKAPLLTSKKLLNPEDKKAYTLNDLKKEQGLLVVFSCNTCPFVVAWEDRYNDLQALCNNNKVGMVLINSNEAKRAGDDSPEKMLEHASKLGYEAPYLVDANHELADAFGASSTPHAYLFDKDMKLVYVGAIDDNYKDAKAVSEHYASDAIKNLATGKAINPAKTKAVGCSIKRVKK